jgi:TolB protein
VARAGAKVACVIAVVAFAASNAASTAFAAFPGANGKIALGRVNYAPLLNDVATVNPDGSDQASLGVEGSAPAWSPDGSQIAFGSDTGIEVMNSDGTGQRHLTHGYGDSDPTWSPDGKLIAFGNTYGQLYVIGVDGGDLRRIAPGARAYLPAWSPDGSKIAITRLVAPFPPYTREQTEIFTVKPDGSDLTRLTRDPSYDHSAAWSPDGAKIAFVSDRDSNAYEIYTMNADGTDVTRLTLNNLPDSQPAWSPDGTKIAFSAAGVYPDPPGYQIYTMNPDGSDRTAITGWLALYNIGPDWQPIVGPNRSDYKNAAEFCKAERTFLGDEAFGRKYAANADGTNAFGQCVSQN